VHMARDAGFKAIAALRGDTGLALAHEVRPDAIILDMSLPVIDGWTVLSHLKRHPATAEIPVHVVSGVGGSGDALKDGAASASFKPIPVEDLSRRLAQIAGAIDHAPLRMLLVGGRDAGGGGMLSPIAELAGVEPIWARSADEAVSLLGEVAPDAAVVEIDVPDAGALHLVERLRAGEGRRGIPLAVASAREITAAEARRIAEGRAIAVNGSSPAALLAGVDELVAAARAARRSARGGSRPSAAVDQRVFEGKRVLIVDDDVRNVFALASALEGRGMEVAYAETGAEGIELLQARDDIDIVLLDVMMPGMDGYETTGAIRAMADLAALPVIAVTAKAMPGDRERAIAAGASDYVTKPVDIDQLLSLMGIWLYPAEAEPGDGGRAPIGA
jgi:CheY-like chemotaxis protein